MSIRITGGIWRGRLLDVPNKGVRPTQDRVRAAVFSSLQSIIRGANVLDLFAGTGAFGLEALSRGAAFACFVENNRSVLAYLRSNVARLICGAEAGHGKDIEVGEAPRGSLLRRSTTGYRGREPRGIFAEPCEAKDTILSCHPVLHSRFGDGGSSFGATEDPPCGSLLRRSKASGCEGRESQGYLAKKGKFLIIRADAMSFVMHSPDDCETDIIFADPPYDSHGEWAKIILFHLSRRSILTKKGYLIIESSAKSPLIETEAWNICWERSYGETRICIYRLKEVKGSWLKHGDESTLNSELEHNK